MIIEDAKIVRKTSYCLEILYDKWSPFIVSAILIVYHILCFLFPWDLTWIEYVCLPSIFTSLHMYNSRQTFMLCKVHRCFVNYVVANIIACTIEYYWIDMNAYWYATCMLSIVVTLVIGLIYYIRNKYLHEYI